MLKRFPSFFPSHGDLNHRLSLFLSNQTVSSSLQYLLRFHALILTSGNSDDPFIASRLVSQYASLRRPASSTRVFRSVRLKDTFLWNSVIKAHFSNGDPREALELFLRMRGSGFAPDKFTLPMAVVACADLISLPHGKTVHGLASKLGIFPGESAVGSSFVYMYCKCGETRDARKVFDEITERDVVAWTALVIGYVQNGESEEGLNSLHEMIRISGDGERPNSRTLRGGFQACGNLGDSVRGRSLHSLAVKTGIECSEDVRASISSMYSKCDVPADAHVSFRETTTKDLVSWMSVISVHSRLGLTSESASLYQEMRASGISPDETVTSCVIWGFGNSTSLTMGKAFHGSIVRDCNFLGETVYNALALMYCKFGLTSVAEKIFIRKLRWTEESCGTMMFGYSKIGDINKCLKLFREMRHRGIEAGFDTLVSVISLCSQSRATLLGTSIHCYLIKNSVDENMSITNSLVDMYGKSGDVSSARRLFCRAQRDTVTWNTMISCYVHNERFSEAIELFDEMVSKADARPNRATFTVALSACSRLASSEKGKNIHRLVGETGLEINLPLATALVDMYAKCGDLEQSRALFDSAKEKDVVLWNAMISGYGVHGHAKPALDLFCEMEKNPNVTPNELTFLALLSACAHSGLVEEGKRFFSMMRDQSLRPGLKHYACVVDLLGRSGNLKEAEDLIRSMPVSPDGGIWGSLLSSCIKHGEVEMGIRIAGRAIESDPGNDGYYVTLSNMYSSSGRWEEAEKARRMMKERGVDKEAGRSNFC